MDHQQHQKSSFTPVNLASKARFLTHRRAHMRACSPHRCARMRTCSLHRCASVRTCSYTGALSVRACSPYRAPHAPHRRAQVCACPIHSRAHMRACSTTGAHIVRAFIPPTSAPMRVYPVGRRARVRAYYRIARACGAHTPKTLCTALRTAPAQKMKSYFYAG
jgi:hypothetical protein